MNPHDQEIEMPDPHFGTDQQMLAWCEDEKLEPVKDEDGQWDWHAVWEIYLIKLEEEDRP